MHKLIFNKVIPSLAAPRSYVSKGARGIAVLARDVSCKRFSTFWIRKTLNFNKLSCICKSIFTLILALSYQTGSLIIALVHGLSRKTLIFHIFAWIFGSVRVKKWQEHLILNDSWGFLPFFRNLVIEYSHYCFFAELIII